MPKQSATNLLRRQDSCFVSGFIIVADLSVEIASAEDFLMVDVKCFVLEVVPGLEVLR